MNKELEEILNNIIEFIKMAKYKINGEEIIYVEDLEELLEGK